MNKSPAKPSGEKKSTKSSQMKEHLTADSVSTAKKRARGAQSRDTQKERIEEHYQQLKDNTNAWVEEGIKKFEETQESFKEYTDELAKNVRNNPLKAVLIAGGIGFILSSLFRK
ncbi:hypothetical protein [Legionella jamestowniensis]|uniref:DUF883 domain-containing protein n=1 Tax=Legionella jamestowniensis TaxID=455 RepID=A0A0W0UZX1_9GAMM|nr:hypothetical protein [Legionella jamestowniensis]KTD13400.1 hypothetical protein Ljam_0190 [Legionella jamestowniensis]OCH98421.1 hypothetical protein A8135_12795 [Legionella jamestowniensis]SFL75973.1 hypothetical protein SAMN02746073_1736 [Legionella jamestowniensis DSM 19215]